MNKTPGRQVLLFTLCGGLKENGPKDSGTIGRYDSVGASVALLEEVGPCGGGL